MENTDIVLEESIVEAIENAPKGTTVQASINDESGVLVVIGKHLWSYDAAFDCHAGHGMICEFVTEGGKPPEKILVVTRDQHEDYGTVYRNWQ